MASILNEYLKKGWTVLNFQQELQKQIGRYNQKTGRKMFIYAADINKAGRVNVSLVQEDFYIIQDILREYPHDKIDVYIETPGGSGEAAEEIAKFLHKKFSEVNFVIAGEAKSAGTILVLSGNSIYMTDTGSLGPIDAQVRIGRSVVSAHDYKAWVDEKKAEAAKNGAIDSFDAIVVAQISPGEIYGVVNSLEFAKDLVKEWLEKYKFKNWTVTQTRREQVTPEKRKERANQVAEMLCDHTTWRSHGRSLKIEDLEQWLMIESIDADKDLADIVYRIKTLIRLIFDTSVQYKLYYLEDFKLAKTAMQSGANPILPVTAAGQKKGIPEKVELETPCPKCGKAHKIVGYFDKSSDAIKAAKLPVTKNVNDNDILICDSCNFGIDLKPLKNQLEAQFKRRLNFK